MAYKIYGTVIHVSETKQISERFRTRDLVIRVDGAYPQEIKFQAMQDRCDMLSGLTNNAEIEVVFDLQGKKHTNPYGEVNWFTTAVVINVNKI